MYYTENYEEILGIFINSTNIESAKHKNYRQALSEIAYKADGVFH